MTQPNLYSPPRAEVADLPVVGEAVQPVRLWSSKGRIGRLRFVAYTMAGYLLFTFVAGLAGALGALTHPSVSMVGFGLGGLVYFAFSLLCAIQRSHDMDWSGWTTVGLVIPIVGFLWLFKGGTRGANRFGAPPPPNTWGVRILGALFPLIFVLGIVAAIAIPAYQGAAARAKAASVQR